MVKEDKNNVIQHKDDESIYNGYIDVGNNKINGLFVFGQIIKALEEEGENMVEYNGKHYIIQELKKLKTVISE